MPTPPKFDPTNLSGESRLNHIEDYLASNLDTAQIPGKLTGWYRKLASDAANCKLVFLGDSTSYEPNDQMLFGRLRPSVTTTVGSQTLPLATINVASTANFPAAGIATIAGQAVTYTGVGATTLTGASGGSGVVPAGSTVVSPANVTAIHTAPGGALYGMTADAAHIINGGNSGVTLAGWLANTGGTYLYANLLADAPDLIIFDWGINDVRLNVDTYRWQTLRDLIVVAINRIRGDLPNSDIILRVAGPSSSDDVSGLHYIQGPPGTNNPAGGAQAFNDIMRKAYLALADRWPNVAVWDAQARVFGSKAIASASTNLWSTQIHPSTNGYALITDYLVNDLIALPGRGKVLPPQAPLQDFGNPVGDGIATTTATAYTIDASALDNTNQYKLVYAGEYNTQAATTLVVGSQLNRVDYPVGHPLDVQWNDIIRLPDGVVYQITGFPTIAAQASGGAIPNLSITGLTVPANTVTSGIVRIYRELSQGDTLLTKIMNSPGPNRYVRVCRVQAGGATTVTLQAEPYTANRVEGIQWAVTPSDSLYVSGGGANPVLLTGTTFVASGQHLRINGLAANYASLVGRLALIVGAHAPETTGDHLSAQSVAAGTVAAVSTADFTVAYAGARFARPFNTVIAQPNAAVAAGVVWTAFVSAADTITLRFCNPTAAGVVVGTLNWDFWLVR